MQQSMFDGAVECRVIPHNQQRYDTVGDWWIDENGWHIRVSYLGNWRYQFLVMLHEFVECAWCKWAGVDQALVDAFDIEYERNRKPEDLTSEPGDDPDAPYHQGHQWAGAVERLLAVVLRVDWRMYEASVGALVYDKAAGE